jgi:DNA polymerase, archaea type
VAASGSTINELKTLIPTNADNIFQKYVTLLRQKRVPIEELAFTKRLSKNSNEYQSNRDTMENDALRLLEGEGKSLKAGEILRYVITDYYYHHRNNRKTGSSRNNRAIPVELFDDKTSSYDVRRYTELLTKTCNLVTEPFGYTLTAKNEILLLRLGL